MCLSLNVTHSCTPILSFSFFSHEDSSTLLHSPLSNAWWSTDSILLFKHQIIMSFSCLLSWRLVSALYFLFFVWINIIKKYLWILLRINSVTYKFCNYKLWTYIFCYWAVSKQITRSVYHYPSMCQYIALASSYVSQLFFKSSEPFFSLSERFFAIPQ